MGIRIPKNQTVESKYTSGGEYMFTSTQNEYKGYYYELNNKTYAGKEFNVNNPEIIKLQSDKYNTLLGSAATYIYGVVSKVKLNNNKPTSIPFDGNIKDRYFIKKINSNIIKEVNEDNFIKLQSDPIYQTLSIKFSYNMTDQELNDLDKKMPGIKIYLQNDINNIPNSSDETNPYIR